MRSDPKGKVFNRLSIVFDNFARYFFQVHQNLEHFILASRFVSSYLTLFFTSFMGLVTGDGDGRWLKPTDRKQELKEELFVLCP